MQRMRLGQISTSGASDGDVATYDKASDQLVMRPGTSGVDAVVVTVVNGVPMLMFDADSTPVTTEVP